MLRKSERLYPVVNTLSAGVCFNKSNKDKNREDPFLSQVYSDCNKQSYSIVVKGSKEWSVFLAGLLSAHIIRYVVFGDFQPLTVGSEAIHSS